MTGFAFGDALGQVAGDYPDTDFVIIDMVVDQPNVRSVVFNENEGSYLVGMLAAMASKTGMGIMPRGASSRSNGGKRRRSISAK